MQSGCWVSHKERKAYVEWWPKYKHLHNAELCCSIYEYLRMPPCLKHLPAATMYLEELSRYPFDYLQRNRILWTYEWIQAAKATQAG